MTIFFRSLFVFLTLLAMNSPTRTMADDSPSLKIGQDAPDWELPGTDGKTYKLSEFKGKKAVVVAWYPAALTGG